MRAAKINAVGTTHLRSVLAFAYETTLNLASSCMTMGNSNATPIQKISESNNARYSVSRITGIATPSPNVSRKFRLTGIITKKTNDAPAKNIPMDKAEYVVINSQKRLGTNALSILSKPTTITGKASICPPFMDKSRVVPNISGTPVNIGKPPSNGESISSAGASKKANTCGCHQKVAPAPILHAKIDRNTVFLKR
jgi:hypothetical protein